MEYSATKITPNVVVMPHRVFDSTMKEKGINDENVESDFNDSAFISIIGTPECLKYYLDEADTTHYFQNNHFNVLNLDFDDISSDELEYEGHIFKGFSMEQAKKTYDFIESNLGKNFYIHCRAGRSRSMAIGTFIRDFYGEIYNGDYDTLFEGCNKDVYRKLSRVFYREKEIYKED